MQLYPRKDKRKKKNHKTCAVCETTKRIDKFPYIKSTGQYHSYCKPCLGAYVLSRYHATKKSK